MKDEHEAAVARVLTMVDASAAVVAPEERDDLFDEFAEDMRESGRVPGEDSAWDDGADADIADAQVFLGIGLTLLGQIAVKVVSVATDMALERGVRDAARYVVGLARGERDGDDEDATQTPAPTGTAPPPPDTPATAGTPPVTGTPQVTGAPAHPDVPSVTGTPSNAGPPAVAGTPPDPGPPSDPGTLPAAGTPSASVGDPPAPSVGAGADAPPPGSDTPPVAAGAVPAGQPRALDGESVRAIADAVASRLALPADVDPQTLRVIVGLQLAAWVRAEDPRPGAR
ncbi:hypothetical protein [Streptomyces sp. NPDC057702]|uniref:hypothetical protein n=1 Tax=unclassified Streptomyces TaxID=2593676 RepID=UPI003683516C